MKSYKGIKTKAQQCGKENDSHSHPETTRLRFSPRNIQQKGSVI